MFVCLHKIELLRFFFPKMFGSFFFLQCSQLSGLSSLFSIMVSSTGADHSTHQFSFPSEMQGVQFVSFRDTLVHGVTGMKLHMVFNINLNVHVVDGNVLYPISDINAYLLIFVPEDLHKLYQFH